MTCSDSPPVIHGPSLGIGAAIAAVSVIAAFAISTGMYEQEIDGVTITPAGDEPTIMPPRPDAAAEDSRVSDALFLEYGSPVLGNSDAPITLVEFGDYQCHFCNVFFQEIRPAIFDNYIKTGKVKMIFKDFTIIGPDSTTAAHAAHCASDQQKFWEYHDILYENWAGENTGWASTDNLHGFAEDLELDMDRFSKCMTESHHSDLIEISNYDARTLGLTGTPAFFISSPAGTVQKVVGAQPYAVFERIFDSIETG